MQDFLIIGLSTFGQVLAKHLFQLGAGVLVIDQNREEINAIKDNVTTAVVADATDRKVLEKFTSNFSGTIIISLGSNLEETIMAVYYLKQFGLSNIYVKAQSEDHGKVLKMLGADKIIFPERDMAIKLAQSLVHPNLLETISLSKDYNIVEIVVPNFFINKTVDELKIRNNYQVNIIAIKESGTGRIVVSSMLEYKFKQDDVIFVLGTIDKIKKLETEHK